MCESYGRVLVSAGLCYRLRKLPVAGLSEASGFIGRGAFAVGALEAWAVCRVRPCRSAACGSTFACAPAESAVRTRRVPARWPLVYFDYDVAAVRCAYRTAARFVPRRSREWHGTGARRCAYNMFDV